WPAPCTVVEDDSESAITQDAIAFMNHCPRCALGQKAWSEVQADHFSFNALAVGAPFLAILLLVAVIEAHSYRQGARKCARSGWHEAAE
ncbi:MAG TPA: hypothetical protein VJV79_15660, partial [Polyangiaceae bacterium]|nr:hypothetical protein [Polyangiaceae bacterium]